MYELIRAGERTWYIDCPVRVGIYLIDDGGGVCLIDSGGDRDSGKKILKIIETNHWRLKLILNTHSHADHVGGNAFLQERTGCPAYIAGTDAAAANHPILEPALLYGGFPCRELRNKFLLAPASKTGELTQEILPGGLEMLRLDGHSFAMTAFRTSDGVWFLADSLTGVNIIEKYHIQFVYDVETYLASLEKAGKLNGKLFIPSHAEPTADIAPLAAANLRKAREIIGLVTGLCRSAPTCEELLAAVASHYKLKLDFNQYALVGSTLRSYLACLHDRGTIEIDFSGPLPRWKTVAG